MGCGCACPTTSTRGRRIIRLGASNFPRNAYGFARNMPLKPLAEYEKLAAQAHGHLCAGQILGLRMGIYGVSLLGLADPAGADRKRLVTFVEIDRCVTDAIPVVTGCRLGKRALKFRDFGKVAATFCDLQQDRAVRLAARETARARAHELYPEIENKNQQQMRAYRESVGTYGLPLGLTQASRRFGRSPLVELVKPATRLARDGVELNAQQAYIVEILGGIVTSTPEAAALFAPGGRLAARRRRAPPARARPTRSSGWGPRARRRSTPGDVAAAIVELAGRAGRAADRGGPGRLRGRRPRAGARRLPRPRGAHQPAAVGGRDPDRPRARACSTREPGPPDRRADRRGDGAHAERADAGVPRRPRRPASSCGAFLARRAARARRPTSPCSTRDGWACSVTCSNGSCSGVIVPGTGVHLNNMLGEQDLNPLGFHRHPPGRRMPSMMAPTIVLRDGAPELALGSAGSNRIRSAILQTIIRVDRRRPAARARRSRRRGCTSRTASSTPSPGSTPTALEARRADDRPLPRAQPVLRRRPGGGARSATARSRAAATPAGAAPRSWCDQPT